MSDRTLLSPCFPDICPRHILHPGGAKPCGDLDGSTIHEEHTHAVAAGIIAIEHGDEHMARLAAFALALAAQLRQAAKP